MTMTLEPRSLIMTINCCFYCGANTGDIFWTEVLYRFGIKHCDAHSADATRDCNAYKHHHYIVDVLEAKDMPTMQPLFAPTTFTVLRKSGVLEDGWSLRHGSHYEKVFISKVQGEWAAPMYKGELIKHVRIRELLAEDDAAQVLAALDTGVYSADAAAASACTPAIPSPDLSCIKQVECDGVVCRVYYPDS